MLGVTHFAGGAATGAAVGSLFGIPVLGMGIGALGGLFLDIDEPGSLIGQKAPFLAWPIKIIFGHRTVTHTLEFTVAMAIIVGIFFYTFCPEVALICTVSFLAGEFSHLLLDSLTRGGVKLSLFFPWHPHGRLRTGCFFTETPIALGLSIIALRLVYCSY